MTTTGRPAPDRTRPDRPRRRTPARGLAAVTLLLVPALACGCSSSPRTGPSPSASPSGGGVSPLTGLPGPTGRILAVKVDNDPAARPQTGLNSADVVYAIEVEGGISRFLAVYDSDHLPGGGRIGPVRSARESDLPVLQQYGKVDFAYSGALTKFLPVLAQADVYNCSPAQTPGSYLRSPSKAAPYNLYVVPSTVLHDFPNAAPAQDVGFRFGPAPSGGTPTDSYTARMPAATFTFTWSASDGKYLVTMDGKPGQTADAGRMGAATVVIQKVAETTSPRGFEDDPGVPSPYAPTTGSGSAVFLRDGKAYNGSWSRPDEHAGTTFTVDGQRMTFRPGQVWVVLEPG